MQPHETLFIRYPRGPYPDEIGEVVAAVVHHGIPCFRVGYNINDECPLVHVPIAPKCYTLLNEKEEKLPDRAPILEYLKQLPDQHPAIQRIHGTEDLGRVVIRLCNQTPHEEVVPLLRVEEELQRRGYDIEVNVTRAHFSEPSVLPTLFKR